MEKNEDDEGGDRKICSPFEFTHRYIHIYDIRFIFGFANRYILRMASAAIHQN